MAKRYYISVNNERGFEELTESEFYAIMGDETTRPYASKVYREEITLAYIPEDLQEAVQTIVNNRIARWGLWKDLPASAHEVAALTEAVATANLTKGQARAFFAALRTLRDGATDAQASTAVDLYPTMKYNEALIKAGTRINWNGVIKRASTDMWDTAENNPDNAPALWEDIEYRDGYRIIPDTITIGTMFSLGEHGWWRGDLYESLLDANVYTPEQYPAGWRLIAQ